ncbi:MAG: condensation domain-containing protein [Prevotella sp.]|nr:condensation domain-containing protein [Prevotella sp.]
MENEKTYMLTPLQREMLYFWQNDHCDEEVLLSFVVALPYSADENRMAQITTAYMQESPVCHSRIVNISGEPRLFPDMNMQLEAEVRYLSDDDCDKYIEHTGVELDFYAGPMIRIFILVTPTRKFYSPIVANLLFDGWSLSKFTNRIMFATFNDDYTPVFNDMSFFSHLERLEANRHSERYNADRQWWLDKVGGNGERLRLTDFAIKEHYEKGRFIKKVRVIDRLDTEARCQRKQITVNEVLSVAWAMALADMTNMSSGGGQVLFSTTKRGRTRNELESLGNFLFETTVCVDINPDISLSQMVEQMRSELFAANRHSLYTNQDLREEHNAYDCGTTVLFNENIHNISVDGNTVLAQWTQFDSAYQFLSGMLIGCVGRFEMEFFYSEPLYTEEDMERFINRFMHWWHELLS